MIHAFTTGYVRITKHWLEGHGTGLMRLANTLFDKTYSEWLPIWCFVIEHPTGLIVIDTGITARANDPIYFPPFMPLVQRAAQFKFEDGQSLAHQMQSRGLNPADVKTVLLTHLHQDHDGGLSDFAGAEFIVSQVEWHAAKGFGGRMGGYLNQYWFEGFAPTTIGYDGDGFGIFDGHYALTDDIFLVPTPGHSSGHQSVIYTGFERPIIFAGDAAYTESALHNLTLDGVTSDLERAEQSMQQLRAYMAQTDAIFLPSHDPQSAQRLQAHLDEASLFLTK